MSERVNGHYLCSEWDYRQAADPLHDVDTMGYLSALSSLPNSLRQMLEDSEMYCETADFEGKYRITKIIKKRPPEFLQGEEHYFIFDKDGKRINLTEEEFNELLGMKSDEEDVLNLDGEQLEGLGSEFSAPLDKYDVIADYTDYVREARQILADESLEPWEKRECLKKAEKLIYSADWFPYPQDKRLHSESAKQIASAIARSNLSKRQLGALLGPKTSSARMDQVKKIRATAAKMPASPKKARALATAQNIFNQEMAALKQKQQRTEPAISPSDRSKLWAMWRERKALVEGKVELMSWQFQKAYRAKLDKQVSQGLLTKEEASERLSARMKAIYGEGPGAPKIERVKAPITSIAKPEWLENAPPIIEAVAEEIEVIGDLPEIDSFDEEMNFQPIFEEDSWINEELEGGY